MEETDHSEISDDLFDHLLQEISPSIKQKKNTSQKKRISVISSKKTKNKKTKV
jgi:hypothetical protein